MLASLLMRAVGWISTAAVLASVAALVNGWQWRRAANRTLAAHPPPGVLVNVGGRRLHLVCEGHGKPTVVFEASGFGGYRIFGRAFQEVAAFTQSCAYDRAGMGYSDPSSEPLDVHHLASDLERLLRAATITPPYILVGMSAGGLVTRVYAHDHPGDVMGLALVDSMPEDFLDAMPRSRASAERLLFMAPWLARLGLLRWIDPFGLRKLPASEGDFSMALNYRPEPWLAARNLVDHLPQSVEEVRGAPLPRRLPLVVITHGVPGDALGPATDAGEASAEEERWQSTQRALADSVEDGTFVRADGAGHIVPDTRPDVVVQGIRRLLHR